MWGVVLPEDRLIRAKDWRFDWIKELEQPHREVYALTAEPHPGIPQGPDQHRGQGRPHPHAPAGERHGSTKARASSSSVYRSNLVAHACRDLLSARGYGGVVAFVAKTKLRQHYIDTLGAEVTARRPARHRLRTSAAELVERYFKGPMKAKPILEPRER
jgi:hypothetical protein